MTHALRSLSQYLPNATSMKRHLEAAKEGILLGSAGGIIASAITRITSIVSGGVFGTLYGTLGACLDYKFRTMRPGTSAIPRILLANAIAIPAATLALKALGTTLNPSEALQMSAVAQISGVIFNALNDRAQKFWEKPKEC